ncbi:glycine cleavage system H-protein subunit [Friedmanniomyces endolithicus]|nr:glycine cleavage system H-protein subunit [Friedmanniomyces endolithicus]
MDRHILARERHLHIRRESPRRRRLRRASHRRHRVNKGDAIGAVESVKSASDIMTPVGGTIIEVNSVLEEKPGTINKSPEGDGWLAKIKVTDTTELEGLMDAEAYRAFTEEVEDK